MDKSIKELDSDFVVTYHGKEKDGNLARLIDSLYDKGFYSQIRDLDQSSLLIFIKVSSYKYAELYQTDLLKNYEFGITSSIDNSADKQRIIYEYLSGATVDDFNLFGFKGVKEITPITTAVNDSTAYQDIANHLLTWKNPSVDFVKSNFGTHVALYFEFFKFFIVWLGTLSILGAISYFKSKHTFSLTFCGANLTAGTLFLVFWKKREKYLISYWGNSNYSLIQDNNSKLIDVNKFFEEKSTFKDKNGYKGYQFLKQLLFVPVALVFVAILVGYQLGCFVLEIFINEIYDGPGKQFLGLVPTVLISVFVPILTIIFNVFSGILIKFENHKNQYTKNNSILIKEFVLNFLTSYMPLIITSFVYLPFAHLISPNLAKIKSSISDNVSSSNFCYKYLVNLKNQEDFSMNQDRLSLQFNYFMITNQVVQLVMKYGLPQILSIVFGLLKKSTYKTVDKSNEASWLKSVRKYVSLPTYNVNDDFRFLTITYGYLILFGPVWSLGPFFALIFMVVTIKLDYLKLLNGKYFKPPIPARVDSIYPWNYALFLLTWLGSIISPAITAFYHHGDKPAKSFGQLALDHASVNTKSSTLLVILLVSEHAFLITWFLLSKVVDLFKSEMEWNDDFTDKDIKLRHDFYSSKVTDESGPIQDDGEWQTVDASGTLSQFDKIVDGTFSGQEATETIESKGTSTGVDIPTKQPLEQVKDVSDKVVKVATHGDDHGNVEGKEVFATIDDNTHVASTDPDSKYQQDYESQTTPPPTIGVDEEETGAVSSTSSGADGVADGSSGKSSKSKSKRSPLKKIFKKK